MTEQARLGAFDAPAWRNVSGNALSTRGSVVGRLESSAGNCELLLLPARDLHLGQSSCSVRSSGCLVKMLFPGIPGILVRSQIFTAQVGSVSILGNSAMERLTAGITVTRMSTGGSFRNPEH